MLSNKSQLYMYILLNILGVLTMALSFFHEIKSFLLVMLIGLTLYTWAKLLRLISMCKQNSPRSDCS